MIAAELGDGATWLGWGVVVVAALTLSTQFLRWSPTRSIGVLQSTTMPGTGILAAIGLLAAAKNEPRLGLAAALVGLVAWVTILRAVTPKEDPAAGTAPTVRVASSNLLFRNSRILEAADALAALDADVVFATEYTPAFAALLDSHPLRADCPYRVEDAREKGSGSALWSRLPILEADTAQADRDTITVTVDGPFGPLAIVAVHPHTPVESVRQWRHGLELIAARSSRCTDPLLVIGDFNASYWHPLFDDLRQQGLLDEHVEAGRGLSTSWPTHKIVPKWLRLDHALTGNGLRAVSVADIDVPGSDHAGLVVDVTVAE